MKGNAMRGNAVINRRRGGIRFPKLRAAVMIIAAAAFLWFLLPIVVGVLNVGNAMGLCVCAVVFLTACFGGRLTERGGIFRMIYYAIVLLLGLGVIWAGILSGLMVWGLSNTVRADEENIPVIVLGCQVKGDVPSTELQRRINTAAEYLHAHPDAVCIASGGQGAGENRSEAAVIAEGLQKQGISADRILLEDTSVNTRENLQNSARLLKEHNLGSKAAIVTDEYHQYRAGFLARRIGLTPRAVNVDTLVYIFPACYMRELLAITKDLVIR